MSEPRFWTDERREALACRWRRGEKDHTIAIAIGTTRVAIRVQRHRQGLVCRRVARSSIKDYSTGALLKELVRRGVTLPKGAWRNKKTRDLAPEMAGGIKLF